jgi:LysR family transcriptional regulator, hydrogen peroxide-inducible genes activator
MTLTQLEYIVALDNYKSFLSASDKSFITQPTLSMQIKKLEEELGVVLFDRTKQPIMPTEIGKLIIEQSKVALHEANKIKELVKEQSSELSGKLKIGIIPTLAPYLLPLFLKSFFKNYPKVTLVVEELITSRMVVQLQNHELDCGILVTPLPLQNIQSTPLFYEPFVGYASKTSKLAKKTTITMDDIELKDMWILNEGHCMRSQVENLCFGNIQTKEENNFQYQSGSIETLIKLVESNGGFTLLPELSINDFSSKQVNMIRYFRNPEPSREVSLLTQKNVIKKRMIDALMKEIIKSIPEKMKNRNQKTVVKI